MIVKRVLNFFEILDEKIFFSLRFRYLTEKLQPYLLNAKEVLDVGSSDGRLAKHMQDALGIKFVGVDTKIQKKSFIPVKVYNGRKLPFKNNSFNCVMLIDVIHHASNPELLIDEAKRVSKEYILIKDHYWENIVGLFLLKISDYVGNRPYGINLPYNFFNMKSWKRMIRKSNMKIVRFEKFRYNILDPCRHVIFKLKVN